MADSRRDSTVVIVPTVARAHRVIRPTIRLGVLVFAFIVAVVLFEQAKPAGAVELGNTITKLTDPLTEVVKPPPSQPAAAPSKPADPAPKHAEPAPEPHKASPEQTVEPVDASTNPAADDPGDVGALTGLLAGAVGASTESVTDTDESGSPDALAFVNPVVSTEPVVEPLEPVAESVGPLAGAVDTVVEPVVTPLTQTLEPAVDTVDTPLTQTLAPAVDNVVEPVVTPLTQTLEPIVDTVAAAVEPVVTPLTQTLAPIVEPVAKLVEPVLTPLTQTLEPVVDTVAATVEPVVTPLTQTLAPIVDTVAELVEPVVTPLTQTLAPIVDTVAAIVEPATDAIGPIVGGVLTVPVLPLAGDAASSAPPPSPMAADPALGTTDDAVVASSDTTTGAVPTPPLTPTSTVDALRPTNASGPESVEVLGEGTTPLADTSTPPQARTIPNASGLASPLQVRDAGGSTALAFIPGDSRLDLERRWRLLVSHGSVPLPLFSSSIERPG